jgi:hypothetical protein
MNAVGSFTPDAPIPMRRLQANDESTNRRETVGDLIRATTSSRVDNPYVAN